MSHLPPLPETDLEDCTQEISDEQILKTLQVRLGPTIERIDIERCRLTVIDGPCPKRAYTLSKNIVRIGSHERNDVCLDDQTVSRFHCEIRRVKDDYLLVDRESTNGTYVGPLRVIEAALYPNCELTIGATTLRFVPTVESVTVQPIERAHYEDLIGASARMREIYGVIDKVAPSELSVVIEGETGTGKELVARALHARSKRAERPLVIFDCSAFPESLLESELFGHEKGAFSGAIKTHRGVFERAEGGTIFFDELGEMALALQPKFLRALENGEIRRVGGERTIRVDVRAIAATNRDLAQLVAEGRFRRDLFYRLAKVRLTLPPLRERRDDISLLAEHFLKDLVSKQPDLKPRRFCEDALLALTQCEWPGNVRELRNAVERAVTFCEVETVTRDELPAEVHARLAQSGARRPALMSIIDPGTGLKEAKDRMVAEFEREYLISLLERHGMNVSRVAREAGIDRRHVYRLVAKYNIPLPQRSN